jgi:hypothetical protein
MTKYEQLKETYRLWVEFLKESDGYKDYCLNIADPKALKKFPIERIYWSGWYDMESDETIDAQYKHHFFGTYCIFRNIHDPNYDFEQWWQDVMIKLLERYEKDPYILLKLNEVALEWYAKEINFRLEIIDNAKASDKEKLKMMKELVKEALKLYFGEKKGFLTVTVLAQNPIDELTKRFSEAIIKHKKQYGITKSEEDEYIHKSVPIPLSGRLSSELEKYLKVYRLRKVKVKWVDILKQISPAYIYLDKNSKEQMDENGRRLFHGYMDKAQNIIKNVENGTFPGKY